MKTYVQRLFALLCLTALPACAQVKYPAKMTFKVTDDAGVPIQGIEVSTSTFAEWERGEGFGRSINDLDRTTTDKEGLAALETPSLRGSFAYGPVPNGSYYDIPSLRYQFKAVVNGRWEPWNPRLEIVVPRILNPIPLHARRLGESPRLELPTLGPVGFDLLVSDWVAPHGIGKRADLVFAHKVNVPAANEDAPFDSAFTITFANPGDGIQSRLAKSAVRLLELPREAPGEGYEPRLERRVTWAGNGTPVQLGTKEGQNYFFRVRTVLDPSGKVISALYGKIYGDIQFFATPASNGKARFTYYLNPTPLDRNLEFNPKRNLFPDTVSGTNITEP
ncbi:MAG: hypothetical protein RL376_159 [Verrucomicrobiota bacterium]